MFVAVRPARAYLVLLLLVGLFACDGPTAPAPPPLSIATTALPAAMRGEAYAEAVHAEGGDGAYEWEISAGALPAGLALSVDDLSVDHAIITGIPEQVETAIFTLTVRSGDGQAAARQFSLVVQPEPMPLAIVTRRLPPALAGGPYNVQILAIGGDDPAHEWRLIDGRLPTGLTLTQDGRIQHVHRRGAQWRGCRAVDVHGARRRP
jgi:hypothetical protein